MLGRRQKACPPAGLDLRKKTLGLVAPAEAENWSSVGEIKALADQLACGRSRRLPRSWSSLVRAALSRTPAEDEQDSRIFQRIAAWRFAKPSEQGRQ